MRERLEEFALSLHPDKTRLIEFGRYAAERTQTARAWQTGDLQVPGLHLHLRPQRARGSFLLHRKSRRRPHAGEAQEIKEELRRRMHEPIPEQGGWLAQVVTGYFAYHAVPTNSRPSEPSGTSGEPLAANASAAQPERGLMWERMASIADDWLPQPRILHPWPSQRFAVKHPRWEPDA